MKKVLVAGASGYLGRYAVRRFKEKGYWVRALVRNPEKLGREGPFLEPAVLEHVDDVYTGEVTRPETIAGACDGIDVVFSSIGITRQKDSLSFREVDYQGNLHLLRTAQSSPSVSRFIFVSVYMASALIRNENVSARERFVSELAASGMPYTIVRPTGFFSDLTALLHMAEKGRVYVIGSGEHTLNPVHASDYPLCWINPMPFPTGSTR